MTPQQILQSIKDQIHLYSAEITDAKIYEYMNNYYLSLREKVTNIDKNYWRDNRQINLNSWQIKYPLLDVTEATVSTPWVAGQLKIERVFVRYDITEPYHRLARQVDFWNLKYGIEYYKNNHSITDPMYTVVANDIYILPAWTDTIVWWLQMEWTKRPYSLNQFTTSANDIFLRSEYHNLIISWTIVYIARFLRNEALSQEYEAYVSREEREMFSNISMRVTKPVVWNIPNYWDQFVYRGY